MTNEPTKYNLEWSCPGGCGYGLTLPAGSPDESRRANNAAFDAHVNRCPKERIRRENMATIHEYVMGTKADALDAATRDRIFDEVWSMQDGYGEAGYTPIQGFDWSGIRDSKAETVEQMARAIRRIVGIAA